MQHWWKHPKSSGRGGDAPAGSGPHPESLPLYPVTYQIHKKNSCVPFRPSPVSCLHGAHHRQPVLIVSPHCLPALCPPNSE
ncbi:hypothetical protein E2C01_005904 [Portunus trituberculatus]|uniref:Uncharacterized protein n=1 Tax=Portunus trituberculatus TaxID=210409 RepID=A0A5B7CWG0_PORTR|nr:hypothetical protein [Portunus trituberculatus]